MKDKEDKPIPLCDTMSPGEERAIKRLLKKMRDEYMGDEDLRNPGR